MSSSGFNGGDPDGRDLSGRRSTLGLDMRPETFAKDNPDAAAVRDLMQQPPSDSSGSARLKAPLDKSFTDMFQALDDYGAPSELDLAKKHMRDILIALKHEFKAKYENLSPIEQKNLVTRTQSITSFLKDFFGSKKNQVVVLEAYKNEIGLCSRSANYLLPKLLHLVIVAAFFLSGYFLADYISMPSWLVNTAKATINNILSLCSFDIISTKTANAIVTGTLAAPIIYYIFDRLIALLSWARKPAYSSQDVSPTDKEATELKAVAKTEDQSKQSQPGESSPLRDTCVSILIGGQGLYRKISHLPSWEYQVYRAAEQLIKPSK